MRIWGSGGSLSRSGLFFAILVGFRLRLGSRFPRSVPCGKRVTVAIDSPLVPVLTPLLGPVVQWRFYLASQTSRSPYRRSISGRHSEVRKVFLFVFFLLVAFVARIGTSCPVQLYLASQTSRRSCRDSMRSMMCATMSK